MMRIGGFGRLGVNKLNSSSILLEKHEKIWDKIPGDASRSYA